MEFSAQQIAMLLGGKLVGDGSRTVSDVAPIETAQSNQLAFICEEKYLPLLETTNAGVVLVSSCFRDAAETLPRRCAVVFVENARGAMAQLLQEVAKLLNPKRHGIEQPAFISDGVTVPEDAYIGAFAYIGKNVRLGKGVQIYPNCYLGDNVKIGDNTILYAGVKVYYNCEIGKDCILHSGVVIGGDGFGFEPDANGINQKIPQIGNVIIEDDVEIGANSTVDRAMMGSTRVKRNAKIDNLVQVAHNVQVGESCFLCAQVGIAGSTTIGDHCIMAGQVGVNGHIEITDHCVFGAKTGIASSVRKPGTYQGQPAMDALAWRKSAIGFKQLPDLIKQVNALSKK